MEKDWDEFEQNILKEELEAERKRKELMDDFYDYYLTSKNAS